MNVFTQVSVIRMSFADIKAAYDFCELPENYSATEYSTMRNILLNEMQSRLHEIFITDKETFKYTKK